MKRATYLTILLAILMGLLSVLPAAAQLDEATLVDSLDTYMQETLPDGWGLVRPDALFAETLENPPFLLDVREVPELEAEGYIEGMVNVPLREIGANLDLLPGLDDPIVIYCQGGHRGAIAMVALQVLGYTDVRNLAGGFGGWVGQDYPVVMDAIPMAEAGEMPDIDADLMTTVADYLANVPEGFGVVRADGLFAETLENPPFLLDVRTQTEWDNDGYIEGATLVTLREIVANLDMLPDKDTPIVVYCKAGVRGAIGMTVLQMLGYDARNLAGGLSGWASSGYPVVGGATEDVEVEALTLPVGEALAADALEPIMADYLANIPQGFSSVAAETIAPDIDDYFVLDVRELDEYEGGHLENALLVPVREVAENLHLLPTDTPIFVYCAAGTRGALATTGLELLGYDAINLRGGIRAWVAADLPITEESAPDIAAGPFPEVDADLWTNVNTYLNDLPAGFSVVRANDLSLQLLEDNAPTIVDVRTEGEFANGHIAGAINTPLRSMGGMLDMLPAKDQPIVLVGSSGQRSAQALLVLQMLGYENVFSLGGGTAAWTGAGLELVTE